MIFTEDDSPTQKETLNPDWEAVRSSLLKIDPVNKAYFILENETKSYVQCTGSINELTIEFREVTDKSFQHFAIGKEKKGSISNVNWAQVNSKVGPVNVHENEVLNIDDAVLIFKTFYSEGDIPKIYSRRDTTKAFK